MSAADIARAEEEWRVYQKADYTHLVQPNSAPGKLGVANLISAANNMNSMNGVSTPASPKDVPIPSANPNGDPDDRFLRLRDFDLLGFWRKVCPTLPLLGKVCQNTLCTQASGCDVERVFSRSGLLVNKLRGKLDPERTERFLFAGLLMAQQEDARLIAKADESLEEQLEYLFEGDLGKTS